MPFDPNLLIPVARELDKAGSPLGEAGIRSACGRAYYAAYLIARERLKSLGHVAPSTGSVHRWLGKKLRGSSDPAVRKLGQRLGKLSTQRVQADYELGAQAKYVSGFGRQKADQSSKWITDFLAIPDPQLTAAL
jgi:hypothetical protein